MSSRDSMLFRKKSLVRIGKIFGSGSVTGAAEDDPGGIATYSLHRSQISKDCTCFAPVILAARRAKVT